MSNNLFDDFRAKEMLEGLFDKSPTAPFGGIIDNQCEADGRNAGGFQNNQRQPKTQAIYTQAHQNWQRYCHGTDGQTSGVFIE